MANLIETLSLDRYQRIPIIFSSLHLQLVVVVVVVAETPWALGNCFVYYDRLDFSHGCIIIIAVIGVAGVVGSPAHIRPKSTVIGKPSVIVAVAVILNRAAVVHHHFFLAILYKNQSQSMRRRKLNKMWNKCTATTLMHPSTRKKTVERRRRLSKHSFYIKCIHQCLVLLQIFHF
jgi:hypothetical protein